MPSSGSKNNLGHDVEFNIYKKNGNLSSTLFGFGAAKYKIKSSDSSLFHHANNEICSHDWLHHEFEEAKQIKAKELSTNNLRLTVLFSAEFMFSKLFSKNIFSLIWCF